MNFEQAEAGDLIQFEYSTDADSDEAATLNNVINLSYAQKATDYDTDPIVLGVVGSAQAAGKFEVEEDSDLEMFVDAYGTRVTIDTDNNDMVKIEVPDEEVYGTISFNFGESSETKTVLVDADEADAKEAELEEDGYEIVGTKTVTAEAVDVDVKGVVTDSEVEGMSDMIVVGGPAVNAVARNLLGIGTYTIDQAGVAMGDAMTKYYESSNTVLVYGYDAADTTAAVEELNAGSNDWA